MGYNKPQWKFLNRSFRETGLISYDKKLPIAGTILPEENYYKKEMLDLGCQVMRRPVRSTLKCKGTARSYFKSIGIKYTSVDIKGCLYSKKVDLRRLIDKQYHNKFDIVSNSGTTEHITPLEGQYQAFKNIHLCTKKNGVMIHILPSLSKCHNHCQIYYDYKFFETLAKLNDYQIIMLEHVKKRENFLWVGACFVKKNSNIFTNDKKHFYKHIEFINK